MGASRLATSALLFALVLSGCASAKKPPTGATARSGRHPLHVGLHLDPSLERAVATVRTARGDSTTIELGALLGAHVTRATREAFSGLTLLAEPRYRGSRARTPRGSALWPAVSPGKGPIQPPDLIVSCRPIELTGTALGTGPCEACLDQLAFRVELLFEIRNLDGVILSAGKVSGSGVERVRGGRSLALGDRFRHAVAEAIDEMAAQYALALRASSLEAM